MALKSDWVLITDDITRSCDVVAEAGVILVKKTAGSGVVIGDSAGTCTLNAGMPSGLKVHGLLLHNIVNIDQTRYKRNQHNGEMLINEPCTVAKRGRFTTNKVTGSPTDGATAYVTASGLLTPTVDANGGVAVTPKVGEFQGIKDESGYVCVDINLPVV